MTFVRVTKNEALRCSRCGGNPYLETLDGPELRCLQCSRLIATLTADLHVPAGKLSKAA